MTDQLNLNNSSNASNETTAGNTPTDKPPITSAVGGEMVRRMIAAEEKKLMEAELID